MFHGNDNRSRNHKSTNLGAEDYYGPPAPGQSWGTYESIMHIPIAAKIGVVGVVALVNPIVAVGVGLAWLLAPQTGAHSNKPTTQGG